MSRFIQPPSTKKVTKIEPIKPTKPVPGSYTSKELGSAKKIPTQGGYK